MSGDWTLDLALLLLRVLAGGLLIDHGTQKLFGWFGGPGLAAMAKSFGSMGLRPALPWALLAGLGEAGGGLLLALGLLNPLGSLGIIGAMLMAIAKVHLGKGLWASKGGSELPLTNLGVALAIGLAGAGRYSLDALLGWALPLPFFLVGLVAVLVVDAIGLLLSSQSAASPGPSARR